MALLNTIFNYIRPVTRNLKTYSSLVSLLLGKRLRKSEEIPTRQESPFLQSYLDAPLLTTTDVSVKKAMAVAAAIAKKRKIEGIKAESPMELASAVDEGITRMKVAYQVGKGILNSTAAAEEIIDRTAARVVSFTEKVIDAGVPIVATAITNAVTKVCPPAAVLAPIVESAVRFVGNAAKKIISKGVEIVANVAKAAVSTVVNSVKKVGRKLKKFLFG